MPEKAFIYIQMFQYNTAALASQFPEQFLVLVNRWGTDILDSCLVHFPLLVKILA
jgi:hypothetical protein